MVVGPKVRCQAARFPEKANFGGEFRCYWTSHVGKGLPTSRPSDTWTIVGLWTARTKVVPT
jgi:hypothetical protein